MLTAVPVKNTHTLTTHMFRKKLLNNIYHTNSIYIYYISLDALTIVSVVSKDFRIATTAG